jgi:alkanesulfonate monooxygenase SsuD/methylene tetrahydromethanopterin reductase-like flavin-dependent oxidoreductase (luciferase family)
MSEIARDKGGADALTEFFLSLQVWGTPEQCIERILDIRRRVGCDTFVGAFSYGGMPYDEAERNLRLFAREVLPVLRDLDEAPESRRASS